MKKELVKLANKLGARHIKHKQNADRLNIRLKETTERDAVQAMVESREIDIAYSRAYSFAFQEIDKIIQGEK